MRATWNPAPGPVQHYKLTYVPQAGGKEMTMKVPSSVTTAVLRKLQPFTSYNINVHPIYKRGEGKARQGVGTTRTLANNSKPMSLNDLLRHNNHRFYCCSYSTNLKNQRTWIVLSLFVPVDHILILLSPFLQCHLIKPQETCRPQNPARRVFASLGTTLPATYADTKSPSILPAAILIWENF